MIDNNVIIAIIVLLAINFLYNKFIESTKDVNEVYLNQQSIIDATRKQTESAIYKSNKLDFSHGLRVGLDIRYDHYKLRNGNLCDVWEVLIKYANKVPAKEITINNETIRVLELNYKVGRIGKYLKQEGIKKIGMHYQKFLLSVETFSILIACLISQVTISFYEDIEQVEDVDCFVVEEQELLSVTDRKHILVNSICENSVHFILQGKSEELRDFRNEYHPEKDKGIAIEFTFKINNRFSSNIKFPQINLISSIASTVKHLPLSHQMNSDDTLLVVQAQRNTSETILNDLTKIMSCFITYSNVKVTNTDDWTKIVSYNPSIISIDETTLLRSIPLSSIKPQNNFYKLLKFNQSIKFLSKGKFMTTNSGKLRLMYVHKSITDKNQLTTLQFNEYRSLLGTRLIMEYGHPNIVGPIIQTDLYDYRVISLSKEVNGFGCISQSLEIKLINLQNDYGTILIRGYNIGKALNTMNGESKALSNNDGFMPINNVRGKWGNDGCLYVHRS